MFAECNVFSAFDLLLSLGFKFVKIFKKNTECIFEVWLPISYTVHTIRFICIFVSGHARLTTSVPIKSLHLSNLENG